MTQTNTPGYTAEQMAAVISAAAKENERTAAERDELKASVILQVKLNADKAAEIDRLKAEHVGLKANCLGLKASNAELVKYAKAVMDKLEQHGPRIVPHLLDTDENDGERLRAAILKAEKGD